MNTDLKHKIRSNLKISLSLLSSHCDSFSVAMGFFFRKESSDLTLFLPTDRVCHQQGLSLWVPFQNSATALTNLYKGIETHFSLSIFFPSLFELCRGDFCQSCGFLPQSQCIRLEDRFKLRWGVNVSATGCFDPLRWQLVQVVPSPEGSWERLRHPLLNTPC